MAQSDDRHIRKAMRVSGIPSYVDYLSQESVGKDLLNPLLRAVRDFVPEVDVSGYNIYPDKPKKAMENKASRDLFYMTAKHSVLMKKPTCCISASTVAMLYGDGSNGYDNLPEIKGNLFLHDFCEDLDTFVNPYSDAQAVAIKWLIKNFIENDLQVFLWSDRDLFGTKPLWGTGFIVNLSRSIKDYKVSLDGTRR